MPFYKFTLPDGRSGRFEAKDPEDAKVQFNTVVHPDMMSDEVRDPALPGAPVAPPVAPPRKGPTKEQLEAQRAADKKLYDPAAGMSWHEKLLAGIGGGMTSSVTGMADLVGLASPEQVEERKEWDKSKENLGNWGTAGDIAGEIVTTLPLGGGVGATGKVLTKAIPKAAELAAKGGKYLNAGALARMGTEGAVIGGAVGKSSDESLGDRAKSAAEGLAAGMAPAALAKLGALPIRMVVDAAGKVKAMLAPSATALEKKVYEAFQKTIGEEGITNAYRAMNDAGPSMVPHTTATMAESAPLGALERGARGRSLGGDFSAHDESVARAAWDMLNDIPAKSRTEAGEALKSKFMRNGVAQGNVFGKGADQVPEITSRRLREGLGEYIPHLSDVEKDTFLKLSDDLMQRDIVKTGAGKTAPQGDGMRHLVSTGLALASAKFNSPKIWKIRSAFNTLSGNAEDKVAKGVDEALLDPDKFMNMVDTVRTKVEADLPLTKTELLLKQAIEMSAAGAGRTGAVATTASPDKPVQRY